MSYRPICDLWLLARPKVRFYGAYPSGFLERARALLGVGIMDPVLHVCGGKVRDYPFRGLGPNDKTLDLDPVLSPDFTMDAREIAVGHPACPGTPDGLWSAVLADPPYSSADAEHYAPGAAGLPARADLLRRCLSVVRVGGRVGVLDFVPPRPPREGVRFVALIAVCCGYGNAIRAFSVYEKEDAELSKAARKRAQAAIRGSGVRT